MMLVSRNVLNLETSRADATKLEVSVSVDCRLDNLLYLSFPFCLMLAADQVGILYPTQQLCSEDTASSPRNANSEDALPSLQPLAAA